MDPSQPLCFLWWHPNLATIVSAFKEEVRQWALAGARGVSHLLALAPPVS